LKALNGRAKLIDVMRTKSKRRSKRRGARAVESFLKHGGGVSDAARRALLSVLKA